jgi:sarcosine oxidase gamma subunit
MTEPLQIVVQDDFHATMRKLIECYKDAGIYVQEVKVNWNSPDEFWITAVAESPSLSKKPQKDFK